MDEFLRYVGAAAIMGIGGWVIGSIYIQKDMAKTGKERSEYDLTGPFCIGACITGFVVGVIRFLI